MKQISENATHTVHLDYFQGKQVRISKSKATGELSFNTEDVARILGYKDHNDMMRDPKVQAKLLEHQQTTGKSALIEAEPTDHIN
jgi:prophage antirepressor-like protein